MSQQINLLLPELRPRRDWLAFPAVAAASLAVIVGIAGMAVWGRQQAADLAVQQTRGEAELAELRQRIQALGQALAARHPDPALQAEVERLSEGVRQRQEALAAVESGRIGSRQGQSGVLRGFARQTMEGVWLTGVALAGSDVEIRGRLTDSALLPHYISRLNGDGMFQGRRFAALDMREASVTPPQQAGSAPAANATPGAAPQAGRQFTEFVLHGKPPKEGAER